MIDRFHRRSVLRIGVTAGTLAIAGCTGGDDVDSTDETDEQNTDSSEDDEQEDEVSLPITGKEVPELAVFDETMLEYMDDLEIAAGDLGVAKDGDLVFERGYGWADPDRTEPVEPDALFRIGSISKPITDAAIHRLVEDGDLTLEEHVSPLLEVEPPNGEPADERFEDVRVEHLLEHEGGWDQTIAGDPMFEQAEIAEALELEEPPDKYDITRYMLDQPMQFDPGERSVYSNVGYSLLGQVIEGVTGMEYQAFLEAELFGPESIDGIELGRTRPENRPAAEVWYDDPETCPDVFDLESGEEGPCADVGNVIEAFDAAGGHVSSTASLLAYLDAYWLSGEPRDDTAVEFAFFGSHPGSFSLARQYPDGVDVVAMFNRRHPMIDPSAQIEPMLEDAIAELEEWP